MRYNIPKKREVAEDPEQDVYFWDGEVCVTSRVITIGNPPTNTISVLNLNGVSLNQDRVSGIAFLSYTICGIFFATFGVASYSKYALLSFVLLVASCLIFYRLLKTSWSVTLKMGGLLADEVFTAKRRDWAERFAAAVGRAMANEQNQRGSGGQAVHQAPIFPDPTFSRN